MAEIAQLSSWRGPVATAAVITTVAQFLAGSLVCRKYIKNLTTGETSGFPFVCGLLSCSLWLRYGVLKGDSTIILVNTIGCTLQFAYVVIYYRYAMKKTTITYQTLGTILLIAAIYGYSAYEPNHNVALERIGFLSCTVTLLFIAAPLTMLLHVIRVRSTETLPFPIILMSLIVSALWYIYGIIIDDPFMQVPNAIGALLAAFQLSLFLFYPSGPPNAAYAKLSQIT